VFFFQAEDGIRDGHVTGVQTCALPIFARWLDVELAALDGWAESGAIPSEDVDRIRERATPPTPERVAEIERITDHDTAAFVDARSEEHTSELQSRGHLVCRLLLEKKKK